MLDLTRKVGVPSPPPPPSTAVAVTNGVPLASSLPVTGAASTGRGTAGSSHCKNEPWVAARGEDSWNRVLYMKPLSEEEKVDLPLQKGGKGLATTEDGAVKEAGVTPSGWNSRVLYVKPLMEEEKVDQEAVKEAAASLVENGPVAAVVPMVVVPTVLVPTVGVPMGVIPTAVVPTMVVPTTATTATQQPREIGDLLADPLSQTVSGKRGGGQDSASGLKIKIKAKTNGRATAGAAAVQASSTENVGKSVKGSGKVGRVSGGVKQNGVGRTEPSSPGSGVGEDWSVGEGGRGGKEMRERKKKRTPAVPRGRAKRTAVVTNGGGMVGEPSPTREPPSKKSKTESAVRQQQPDTRDVRDIRAVRDVSTSTASVATCTEPDLLGPLEPGSSITLEGIVWRETPAGILVINVTYRGKTYVGSLLDCSKHNWMPAGGRGSETPPSDSECNRSSAKDRALQKRNRNGLPDSNSDLRASSSQPLRGGKTRRGANFQTPVPVASPACSETGTPAKRKGRRPNNLGGPSLRGSEPKDTLSDLPSPTDESKPKRGRRAVSGSSTPGVDPGVDGGSTPGADGPSTSSGPLGQPASPDLIDCPDPRCGKKFSHRNALTYHLQKETSHRPSVTAQSSYEEEQSSDSREGVLVNGDSGATTVSGGTVTVASGAASISGGATTVVAGATMVPGGATVPTEKKVTSSASPKGQEQIKIIPAVPMPATSTPTKSVPVIPASPVGSAPVPAPAPLSGPLQSHLDLVLSGAVNFDGVDEDAKQKSKQRRKQSNPVSSQQKRGTEGTGGTGGTGEGKELVNGGETVPAPSDDLTGTRQSGGKMNSTPDAKKEPKSTKSLEVAPEHPKDAAAPQINGFSAAAHIPDVGRPLLKETLTPLLKSEATPLLKPEPIRIPIGPPFDTLLPSCPPQLPLSLAPQLPPQLPLNLKINSPPLQLQPAKIGSPLLTSVASPAVEALRNSADVFSEVKVSPAQYEDISDDETEEASKKTVGEKTGRPAPTTATATTATAASSTDKPAFFPFGQPPPYLVSPFGGAGVGGGGGGSEGGDRQRIGSPADLTKQPGSLVATLAGFPNFIYGGVPAVGPYSPVAFGTVSHSPQPLESGKVPGASPVTVPKVGRSSAKESAEKGELQGKMSAGKEMTGGKVLSESKGDAGRGKEELLKSPLEDVTASHNKMHLHPGYMHGQFAGSGASGGGGGGNGGGGSYHRGPGTAGFPPMSAYMGAAPSRQQMYAAEQMYFQAMYGAGSPYGPPGGRGSAGGPSSSGMPPGMPQMGPGGMPGVGGAVGGPGDMGSLQQRLYQSNQHKIHELTEESPKSENKKPTSKGVPSEGSSASVKGLTSQSAPPDGRSLSGYLATLPQMRHATHPS